MLSARESEGTVVPVSGGEGGKRVNYQVVLRDLESTEDRQGVESGGSFRLFRSLDVIR